MASVTSSAHKPSQVFQGIDLGNIIYICLEDSDRKFGVHKDLICKCSSFFERAFNGDFKEAGEKEVRLDEDPVVVEWFVHWLYTCSLPRLDMTAQASGVIQWLCALFLFAEKRLMPDLKKAVVARYVSEMGEDWVILGPTTVSYIYENTLADSALRRLAVDDYVMWGIERIFEQRADDPMKYPKEFLLDYIKRLVEIDALKAFESLEDDVYKALVLTRHIEKKEEIAKQS